MQFNNPNPNETKRGFNEVVLSNRLGAPCHFNSISNPVPVYVITDLKGNIIVNNCYIPYPQTSEITDANIDINNRKLTQNAAETNALINNKVLLNKEDSIKLEALQKQQEALTAANKKIAKSKQEYVKWFISGVKTTVTRFFSCSTATVMLTCAIEDEGQFTPQLPNYLKAENDICIWAGFIESYRPVRQSDLTTKLLRIFTGIIDTNQLTGTGTGGYTVAISCRDRLKWLMDTSNTFDIQASKQTTLFRSDLILQIAQTGIGFTKEAQGLDEKKSYKFRKITYTDKDANLYNNDLAKIAEEDKKAELTPDKTRLPSFERIYVSNLTDYKKSPPLAGNIWCPLEVNVDPEFFIYTSRVGISTQNTAQLMIKQQHPVDMLKTLSMQEVYPTDVFQDHRDGNFYYYPHASDYNSLNDPKRYFRTYFFRVYPSLANKDLANLSYKTASEYEITDTINLGFDYKDANLYFDGQTVYNPIKLGNPEPLVDYQNDEVKSTIPKNNKLTEQQQAIITSRTIYKDGDYHYIKSKDIKKGTKYIVNYSNDKATEKIIGTASEAGQFSVDLTGFSDKFKNSILKYDIGEQGAADVLFEEAILFETEGIDPNILTTNIEYRQLAKIYQRQDDAVALLPPHVNQMIISLRHEQSSVGVFTNFILYKSNNQEQLVTTEWTMHLELMPEDFLDESGNSYNVAKKFVRIEDPNIQTPAEGISVLLNAARIYARSLQVASIIINGDPSICPGEIFQVFGSPLLKNDGIPNLLQDRYNYLLMKNLSITNFKELAVRTSVTDNLGNSNANPTTNQPIDPNKIGDGNAIPFTLHNNTKGTAYIRDSKTGDQALTSEQVLDKPTATVTRNASTTIPETKTIYRAEACSHKLNIGGSRGFTTEVALTIPY